VEQKFFGSFFKKNCFYAWMGFRVSAKVRYAMRLSHPTSFYETLCLFQHYSVEGGLAGLLQRVDWAGATAESVNAACFGPERPARQEAVGAAGYDAGADFLAKIQSEEFRAGLIRNILDAFPKATRHLFVHVPKCAGKDLKWDLARILPVLPTTLGHAGWTNETHLFITLSALHKTLSLSPGVVVAGHVSALSYSMQGILRDTDRMFAVIREPTSIILSLVNYIVSTMLDDPEMNRVDTREWAASLGISELPPLRSDEEKVEFAKTILRDDYIMGKNHICSNLGCGTFVSTLDVLNSTNIEVCDVSRYDRWRMEKWGLEASQRQGKSDQLLRRDQLTDHERLRIETISSEDNEFYKSFTQFYCETSRPSIYGAEFVAWLRRRK